MFSDSDIRANRWVMRSMLVGGSAYKCWYCEDTGKFYESDEKRRLKAVGWIPCPHCAAGKSRMEYAKKREVFPLEK